MHSNNPVLTRDYGTPVGFRTDSGPVRRVTMDSVIVRSAFMLFLVVASGAAAWILNLPMIAAVVAGLGAFVVGMVAAIKRKTSPILYMTYAVLEGAFIGVFSHLYESQWRGIVLQAVFAVVIVFAVMLTLYATRIVKVTNKFTKIVLAAGLGYVGLMLVNLVVGIWVPGGLGIRDGGALSIGVSIAALVIGALFYALDFDEVERMIDSGAPEKESWRAAFGLTLTTIWVYIEALRLIGYIRGSD